MLTKLQEATTGFRQVHLSIVDLLEEETDLEVEQAILDEHDDIVSAITLRLKALIEPREEPPPPDERKILARRLKRVEGRLTSVNEAITALGETPALKNSGFICDTILLTCTHAHKTLSNETSSRSLN